MVPFFAENFGKTSPRGKAALLTLLINVASAVKNKKILECFVLPISFKYIDDLRPDIKNEAGRLVFLLYKILGNAMLQHIPSNKMQKAINVISNKLE